MPRLLIVDDDPSIRKLLAKVLAPLGKIDVAAGGADALHVLATTQFDGILLDLHMPGIDGFAVLDVLSHKLGPNKDTPVFVMTADVSDRAKARAIESSAVLFVNKPFAIATLYALIEAKLVRASAARKKVPR